MEDTFVFGVDLDGVVADFYEGLRKVAAEWLGVNIETLTKEVTYGLPEWNLKPEVYLELHKFAVTQRQLFKNLEPIPGAPVALRNLSRKDVRIRIITHRLFIKYFHQQAVQQTIEWLDYHDIPYWDLCFMAEKIAVGANLYIEDTPKHVEELRAQKLQVIVFSNSTNPNLEGPRAESWEDVEQMVLLELDRWKNWKLKKEKSIKSKKGRAK
jgi:5'(3')-deoxyribonucleotidase